MASFAASRSIFRSNSARNAADLFASKVETKAPSSPFGVYAKKTPLSLGSLRNHVQMSVCVESMLPYHTATASLTTSMRTISCRSYGWVSEGL